MVMFVYNLQVEVVSLIVCVSFFYHMRAIDAKIQYTLDIAFHSLCAFYPPLVRPQFNKNLLSQSKHCENLIGCEGSFINVNVEPF